MFVGFGLVALLLWFGPGLRAWWSGRDEVGFGWTGAGLQWGAVALSGVAVLFGSLGLFFPERAKPVYIAWMTATLPIGMVMSTVVLTLLFVVLLPPFALWVRLQDPMRRKLTKGGTYWEPYKPHEPTLERMRRPF